jgi:hypothetical protein
MYTTNYKRGKKAKIKRGGVGGGKRAVRGSQIGKIGNKETYQIAKNAKIKVGASSRRKNQRRRMEENRKKDSPDSQKCEN